MKVFSETRKSRFLNEDTFILGNDYFLVIDGATPLIKTGVVNLAWYMVNYIKKHIDKLSGSIKERLEHLSIKLKDELNIPLDDKAYLPSASLSYVEIKEDFVNIGILGDCEVVIKTKDNKLIRFYNESLSKFDNEALKKQIEIAKEKNISILDAREYIQDILIDNRRRLNTKDGYNAFTIGVDVLSIEEYKIDKNNIQEIYLYSDGFASSFNTFKIYESAEDMFKRSLDLKEEVDKIKQYAFNDLNCNHHPRFKTIDDITAIKIELN